MRPEFFRQSLSIASDGTPTPAGPGAGIDVADASIIATIGPVHTGSSMETFSTGTLKVKTLVGRDAKGLAVMLFPYLTDADGKEVLNMTITLSEGDIMRLASCIDGQMKLARLDA